MELKLDDKGVEALNAALQVNGNAEKNGVLNHSAAYGQLVNFLSQNLKPVNIPKQEVPGAMKAPMKKVVAAKKK